MIKRRTLTAGVDMEKIDVDLKGVPRTLLLPLLGRAIFSNKPYSPIHDARAIQLTKKLNFDFNSLSQSVGSMTLYWVARAYHFDRAIKQYLKKNPTATIVNLGAGLETAFYRVDNRQLDWIDLDLPDVINLRKKLLPPSDRVHNIAKSLFDFTWMEDIKKFNDKFFFFAGGVFMYFPELEVRSLFIEMAKRFQKSQLVFDVISHRNLKTSNKMLSKAQMDSELKWALDDAKDLEKWSSNIKVVSQMSYFEKINTRLDFPLSLQFRMLFYEWWDKRGIVRVKFVKQNKL